MSILHLPRNTRGRDFFTSDIHGSFHMLVEALMAANFNFEVDRLIVAGDLVARGPYSTEVDEWLAQPWFFSTVGNHEERCWQWRQGELSTTQYYHRGGDWFIRLSDIEQQRYIRLFAKLPYAIEVETVTGLIGVVHAEVFHHDWVKMKAALRSSDPLLSAQARWVATNQRSRFKQKLTSPVMGVERVYVGHTPVKDVLQLGNVFYLDGATYREGGRVHLLTL